MTFRRASPILALIALLCIVLPNDFLAQQNIETKVLNVTVTNPKGRILLGLEPEHFTVKADGLAPRIVSCSMDKSPANVGILFDTSSSVVPWGRQPSLQFRQRVAAGISRFLELSNPENDYFLTTFDGRVSFTSNWTGSNASIEDKLVTPEINTGTALYDAIYYGIEHVPKGRHARQVLLLISDGQDNTSKKTYKEVFEALKRSDISFYALGFLGSAFQNSALGMESEGVLADLTEITGGRSRILPPSAKPDEIKVAFENLANELQTQYRLAIETEKPSSPQKWRNLKLEVRYVDETGRRPEVHVKTRKGFYR